MKGKRATNALSGHIDDFTGGYVVGWAFDKDRPDLSLRVGLCIDGIVVGSGVADGFRDDLLDGGMGNGKHGFRVRLTKPLTKGKEFLITLVEAESGRKIETNEFLVAKGGDRKVEILGVSGGCVQGEVLNADDAEDPLQLVLHVDSNEFNATTRREGGGHHFSVPLPASAFDGMPHVISVAVADAFDSEAYWLDVLPSNMTPWEHLIGSANTNGYSSVPRTSGYRYESLRQWVAMLATQGPSSAVIDLHNLTTAHDAVVEGHFGRSRYPRLTLPVVDGPLVSIVIPAHNKFELTYHCIASIILAANRASYEVIVVDDCSTDQTKRLPEYIENVRTISNEANLGFLHSSNKGAAVARGQYIVMLNNDTEVTSGWLDEMLDTFKRFDGVGLVGSKLIYPDGKLQEAGGIVWGTGAPWNIGSGKNPNHPSYSYARQVDYLSGASLMIAASVWREVGGFSEEFAPAYYEDTDLAFKVRDVGYKTVYCPFSVVIHFEGMSNGRDVNCGVKKYQLVNTPKFRQKWVDAYRHNGPVGQNLLLNMDRNVAHRVLMLDYAVPRPDHDAGSYAAVQEMRMLQASGCKVTFVGENMAHMGKYTDELQRMGVECLYAPFYCSIDEVLQARGSEFDVVYITRFDVAERHLATVRKHTQAKVLFNNADLHFMRELRAALASKSKDLSGPLNTRDRELSLMRHVDAVLSYSDVELAVITSHNLRDDNMFLCPWVLTAKGHTTSFTDRKDIAFLGGYAHQPNVEAVEYFVREVMPLLRKRLPGVRFRVYGSRMPDSFAKLASEDVVLDGFVDSLDEVFESCRVFVAPLLSGAGIKGKVLDAMSYGVPSVLSSIAIESTGLSHGANAFEARSPEEWMDYISKLYEDDEIWHQFSAALHKLSEEKYSFGSAVSAMRVPLEFLGVFAPRNNRSLVAIA